MGLPASRELHDGWMAWNELNVNLPEGFFLNVWNTTQLAGHTPLAHGGDELDLTAGWQADLFRGVKFTLAETYMDFYPLGQWWNGDVLATTIRLSKEFSFGNQSIKLEMWIWWIAHSENFEGGSVVLMPNITHKWRKPFGINFLTIRSRHMFVWDDGWVPPRHSSDGLFYRLDAGLDWQLSKHVSLTLPGFIALVPVKDSHDLRDESHTSISASLRFTF